MNLGDKSTHRPLRPENELETHAERRNRDRSQPPPNIDIVNICGSGSGQCMNYKDVSAIACQCYVSVLAMHPYLIYLFVQEGERR